MKIPKIIMLLISIFTCEMYSQEKVIEKYQNGNLKFEGYSINKVLDSVYKEYYENGNLKVEGFYKDCKYETNRKKIFILSCGVGQKTDSLTLGTRHGKLQTYYEN